jgi:hypothetical protein
MPTAKSESPLPLQQMADDGKVLRDEYAPNRDWDCDDYWLALGSTIQVAKAAVEETMGEGRGDSTWDVADDWEVFVEALWDNVKDGTETLVENDCLRFGDRDRLLLDAAAVEVYMNDRGEPGDFALNLLHDHISKTLDTWYTLAAKSVHEELEETNQPTDDSEHAHPSGSGESYRMMCAEGDSLSEVEMEMNDQMNDDDVGAPDSLTVDRDESMGIYYACALLKKTAEDMRGDR